MSNVYDVLFLLHTRILRVESRFKTLEILFILSSLVQMTVQMTIRINLLEQIQHDRINI